MIVKKMQTKTGQEIPLGKFTVLVGPNNTGKSQTLKDIHSIMNEGNPRHAVILNQLTYQRPTTFDDLIDGLRIMDNPSQQNSQIVHGISSSLHEGASININFTSTKEAYEGSNAADYSFDIFGRFKVAYLDASSRLQVALRGEVTDMQQSPPQNLLQALFHSKDYGEEELRNAFKEVFGIDIKLDYSAMINLVLRVGKEFPDVPTDPRKMGDVLRKFRRLNDEGDGFKSFAGVVLSVILTGGRILLMDEPDAFLHPAQARQLGTWLAKHIKAGQAQIMVATHNSYFLEGIIASGVPVDIFRLNRADDVTTYEHIGSSVIDEISRSPVLSSQRVLESLFHTGVVVSEGDADRTIYRAVAVKALNNQEVLFIHAHNKQTIPTIVSVLRKANIPVCAVADIDVLSDKTNFEDILTEFETSELETEIAVLQGEVAETLEGEDESKALSRIETEVKKFMKQLNSKEHTLSGARSALKRIRDAGRKWEKVKVDGIEGIPKKVRRKAQEIIDTAKISGLFIVPVGELESWIDLGTRRKKRWIIMALEKIYADECPNDLRNFVNEMIQYLSVKSVQVSAG